MSDEFEGMSRKEAQAQITPDHFTILTPEQDDQLGKVLSGTDLMFSKFFAYIGDDLPTLDEADEISKALDEMEDV